MTEIRLASYKEACMQREDAGTPVETLDGKRKDNTETIKLS